MRSSQIGRLRLLCSDGREGRWDGWLRLKSSHRSLLRGFGLQALLMQFNKAGHAAPEARFDYEMQK
jgi:hypothetical protein